MPCDDEVQSNLSSDPKAVAGLHAPCPRSTVSFPSAHRAHLFCIDLTPPGCQSCLQSNTPTLNLKILLFLPWHTFHIFSPTHLATPLALFQVPYWHYTASAVIFFFRVFFQLQNTQWSSPTNIHTLSTKHTKFLGPHLSYLLWSSFSICGRTIVHKSSFQRDLKRKGDILRPETEALQG